MRYAIDIKLIGYEQITVEAETEEDAYEKALDRFWKIYHSRPASDLSHKETESTLVNTYE